MGEQKGSQRRYLVSGRRKEAKQLVKESLWKTSQVTGKDTAWGSSGYVTFWAKALS